MDSSLIEIRVKGNPPLMKKIVNYYSDKYLADKICYDLNVGSFSFGATTLLGEAGRHMNNATSFRYTIGLMEMSAYTKKIKYSIGLNIEFNSMHLDPQYAFVENQDGKTSIVSLATLQPSVETSRLHITYLDIPLLFTYRFNRDFSINVGPELKIRTASSSKIWLKNRKSYERLGTDLGLHTVLGSAMLKVKYNGLGFYLNYDLTPAFKEGFGPKGNMLSAGVLIGF